MQLVAINRMEICLDPVSGTCLRRTHFSLAHLPQIEGLVFVTLRQG